MKLILNDIKYLSLKDIYFYRDRIYYHINDIKMNGLYFKITKNMVENNNKYTVYLNESILKLNDLIGEEYKSFIRDTNNPSIEVVRNNKTDDIFYDNEKYIILSFMSINDNNYPKIHILPCRD
jgi:hypothetical protein